ncbi:hypothetical protein PCE1_001341 [Barthelona sp. PCE]
MDFGGAHNNNTFLPPTANGGIPSFPSDFFPPPGLGMKARVPSGILTPSIDSFPDNSPLTAPPLFDSFSIFNSTDSGYFFDPSAAPTGDIKIIQRSPSKLSETQVNMQEINLDINVTSGKDYVSDLISALEEFSQDFTLPDDEDKIEVVRERIKPHIQILLEKLAISDIFTTAIEYSEELVIEPVVDHIDDTESIASSIDVLSDFEDSINDSFLDSFNASREEEKGKGGVMWIIEENVDELNKSPIKTAVSPQITPVKRLDFNEKIKLAEKRREEKHKKIKEQAQKQLRRVDEVRLMQEIERQNRKAEIDHKLTTAEQKKNQHLTTVSERARDQTREVQNRVQLLKLADLEKQRKGLKELNHRLSDSEKRRRSRLESIAEKASAETVKVNAAKKRRNIRLCKICNVVLKTEADLMAHVQTRSHLENVRSYTLSANDVSSELVFGRGYQPNTAHVDPDRMKGLKRKYKRIRTKIYARSRQFKESYVIVKTMYATQAQCISSTLNSMPKRMRRPINEILEQMFASDAQGIITNIVQYERSLLTLRKFFRAEHEEAVLHVFLPEALCRGFNAQNNTTRSLVILCHVMSDMLKHRRIVDFIMRTGGYVHIISLLSRLLPGTPCFGGSKHCLLGDTLDIVPNNNKGGRTGCIEHELIPHVIKLLTDIIRETTEFMFDLREDVEEEEACKIEEGLLMQMSVDKPKNEEEETEAQKRLASSRYDTTIQEYHDLTSMVQLAGVLHKVAARFGAVQDFGLSNSTNEMVHEFIDFISTIIANAEYLSFGIQLSFLKIIYETDLFNIPFMLLSLGLPFINHFVTEELPFKLLMGVIVDFSQMIRCLTQFLKFDRFVTRRIADRMKLNSDDKLFGRGGNELEVFSISEQLKSTSSLQHVLLHTCSRILLFARNRSESVFETLFLNVIELINEFTQHGLFFFLTNSFQIAKNQPSTTLLSILGEDLQTFDEKIDALEDRLEEEEEEAEEFADFYRELCFFMASILRNVVEDESTSRVVIDVFQWSTLEKFIPEHMEKLKALIEE